MNAAAVSSNGEATATLQSVADDGASETWILESFRSVGPLRFGMTLVEASVAVGAATCEIGFESEDPDEPDALTRATRWRDREGGEAVAYLTTCWFRHGRLIAVDLPVDGPRVVWKPFPKRDEVFELTGQPFMQLCERIDETLAPGCRWQRKETPEQARQRWEELAEKRAEARLARREGGFAPIEFDAPYSSTYANGAETARFSPAGAAWNHWWGFVLLPQGRWPGIEELDNDQRPCAVRAMEYRESLWVDVGVIHGGDMGKPHRDI